MKRKNIVTIGGGTGSYTLLTGLKKYPVDLTAIVTMTDDGGSTGILRDELGVLPPGDIRQCLVALSDAPEILRKLFLYRFETGRLKGHNFGNLFLSALERIDGSFEEAIEEARRILHVTGNVLPVTKNNTRLVMVLGDRTILRGENMIYKDHTIQKKGIKDISFSTRVSLNSKARQAIRTADLIIIGPGDLYSSIIPNLIVPGMSSVLRNTKAKKIYVANLTNKKGQTTNFSVIDYISIIERYIGENAIDYVIANNKEPSQRLYRKYQRQEGVGFWINHRKQNHSIRTKILYRKLLDTKKPSVSAADVLSKKRAFIRHDSDRLAQAIISISTM